MSTMVKKRTAELVCAQLNWAVAVADGQKPVWFTHNRPEHTVRINNKPFNPDSDWKDGGPIIERERIELQLHACSEGWWAGIRQPLSKNKSGGTIATGPIPLIAAMRAFVASKLGEEVEVPE